ncbi:semaphorin [Pigeonpox virus]|uniref:Semaphorin n=1 Tax=Pigeonpox virus TaxID=10264 RepID=A0A068EG28_9POXV|nr:semaphorin [Pigeonpox virus]AID46560.1 semaphorin [Pigeonpox virus]
MYYITIVILLVIQCNIAEIISPRIKSKLNENNTEFMYRTYMEDVVVYHTDCNTELIIGVTNTVYLINITDKSNITIDFSPDNGLTQLSANYITFIGQFNNKTLVCGTNATSPACWYINGTTKEPSPYGRGFTPEGYDMSGLVLIDGEEVYSTIKKYTHLSTGFRRIVGNPTLYTSSSTMKNPRFVHLVSLQETNSMNDTIYIFLEEQGMPKVSRVCKHDQGGSGSLASSKWSTFLKSIMICEDDLRRQFNNLKDVVVIKGKNPNETVIYGLFFNEWNYSAVCMFKFNKTQNNFNTSPLKGYSGKTPSVRPGTCINTTTPKDTFNVIDSHPETLYSIKGDFMFEAKYMYTHLTVNTTVINYQHKDYTVTTFYLSTDNGKIHKVVVYEDGTINVMELTLKQYASLVLSLVLDECLEKLFVSYNDSTIELPLAFCYLYGNTCDDCFLSRDPHCGWTNNICDYGGERKLLQKEIYDVPKNICSDSLIKKEAFNRTVYLSSSSYHVLSCPIESHQANYMWINKDNKTITDCGITDNDMCYFFIHNVDDSNFGNYTCISEEGWSQETIMIEELTKLNNEYSK